MTADSMEDCFLRNLKAFNTIAIRILRRIITIDCYTNNCQKEIGLQIILLNVLS